jgi:hypothetical protein
MEGVWKGFGGDVPDDELSDVVDCQDETLVLNKLQNHISIVISDQIKQTFKTNF